MMIRICGIFRVFPHHDQLKLAGSALILNFSFYFFLVPEAAVAAPDVSVTSDIYIAGTAPNARPRKAPVIKKIAKDDAWWERAHHGITKPYPESLKFLDDQGGWFTPFIHPGMGSVYDLRNWHGHQGLDRSVDSAGVDGVSEQNRLGK